jgi:hypothetical protein
VDFFALGASGVNAGPGYPLVSFLPVAKKDTASIPCAGQMAAAIWPWLSIIFSCEIQKMF